MGVDSRKGAGYGFPRRAMRRVLLLIILTATPAASPAQDGTPAPADSRFAAHVEALRKRLPHPGFTVVAQPPFVVAGDQEAEDVRGWAEGTVRWAVERLKREYFEKDPDGILDVWLFKDEESYRKHAKALFGEEPDTPFGYYSPRHRALIMNIGTGGGTLVHEIVHPFVAANFPKCPSWLNEGLGSLYEQSHERAGRIVGLPNWRLEGLQEAIKEKRVPTFAALCATTSEEFYEKDRGTNYAQARYLCYWLQEKNLLKKFWHEARARHAEDPGCYKTLQRILGEDDMSAFQSRWESFVLALKYP